MRALLLLLLLSVVASAEPRCLQPKFELTMLPAGQALQPNVDRDPDKAVALLRELFIRSGPRLGCRWVESCFLLALSDQRTRGAWNGFLRPSSPDDFAVVDKLNDFLVPRGISLHGHHDQRGDSIEVVSLGGLDFTSHQSHVSWMQPFDRSTGWAGYYQWLDRAYKSAPEPRSLHRVEGFLLGYPDSAVEWLTSEAGQQDFRNIEATVPEANTFKCGLPIWTLNQKDVDAPDQVETEQRWSTFLSTVYRHPQRRALTASPEFVAARLQHNEGRSDADWRSAPDRLNTAQLRWLRQHQDQLASASATATSGTLATRDVAEDLNRLAPGLEWRPWVVENLVVRAALDPQFPAQPLLAAARTTWSSPNDWMGLLRDTWGFAVRDLPEREDGEWPARTNNFVDLLALPDTPAAVTSMSNDDARAWFAALWRCRSQPQAAAFLARIQSGQVLAQKLAELRAPWVWPPAEKP